MHYVISDIHGMYDKYIKMLELIDFKDIDHLYILGDIVDRGNSSIKILKDLMNRTNVTCLIGNHELMMVECLDVLCQEITDNFIDGLDEEIILKLSNWISNGGFQTIQELKKLTPNERNAIKEYLLNFIAYEELTVNNIDYLLVHAGLRNFEEGKSLEEYDLEELIWERPNWEEPYYKDTNKYIIVGHTPTLSINEKAEIFHKNNFIAIDCGCCFDNGKLSCLCLETMEEFYV